MSELDKVLEEIRLKYDVITVPFEIGDKVLKILEIRDFDAYVEKLVESELVGLESFPYWAKIWESSFLLAFFLGKQPVVPWRKMLEIGAGMGIVGVYASLCGHDVTITEQDDDALLFARANVLLNGARAEVRKLDWKAAYISEPFDVIFGAEVVYDRGSYGMLVDFLKNAVAPDGVVFIGKNADLKTPGFFMELTRCFKFKQTAQTVRCDGEAHQIELYAIKPKEESV